MHNEILKLLIEMKFEFLSTISNACMLWWVSSVVFCASLLGGVWRKKKDVIEMPFMNWFFALVCIFIASIVIFGFWVVYVTFRLETQLMQLLSKLKIIVETPYEIMGIRIGIILGTTSFLFVFVTWIGMWFYFNKLSKKSDKNKKNDIKKTNKNKTI